MVDVPAPPSRGPRPRRAATSTPLVVAVVMAVLLVAPACSSSPPAPDAAAAAEAVSQGFGADDGVRGCLTDGFEASSAARSAMGRGGDASQDEQEALGEVLGACLPPEELATLMAVLVAGALGGEDPDSRRCVEEAVAGLSTPDRTTLLVGLALSGDSNPAQQLDLDLGEVTSGILATCDLSIDPDPGSGPTDSVAGDSSAVSSP